MEWREFHSGLAKYVSSKSKDNSTRVGAVIVDNKNRIVSVGFNGSPRKVSDACDREKKLMRTVHAEMNALHFANRSVEGCTIYVTHPPCAQCAAHLIQREISEVVFPTPSADFLSRWKASYDEAMLMFKEAGVEVVHYGIVNYNGCKTVVEQRD